MSPDRAPGGQGAPGVNGRAPRPAAPAAAAGAGRSKKPAFLMQQLLPESEGYERLPGARRINIWHIDPNPDQPRSELTRIEELAASIAEYGLLQPVVVSPAVDGRYTLIAGHRRLEAHKYLAKNHENTVRWSSIDAIERDGHSDERLVLALLENLSREDLPESDIVKGLHLLHELRQWHQSEIARRLGVSRQWISQYFRVATDAVLSEHVQTHQLTVTKAYDIQLARDEPSRDAALEAALHGASRALVRRIAKQGPEAAAAGAADGDGAGEGTNGHANGDAAEQAGAAGSARYVASAAPYARVGNLAEVADELDLTMRFDGLELTNLIRDAVENGTDEFRVGDFLRLVRNDVRRLEGLVRARRPVGTARAGTR